MKTYSDCELLEQFRNENSKREAFTVIVNRHKKRLYWTIRKIVIDHYDADDVLQNVLIRAWNGLDKFKGNCSIYSWLYRITVNEARSFLRTKKRRLAISEAAFNEYLENTIQSNLNINYTMLEEKLQRAILTLPNKQKQVFMLRYYDDLPYEQMSEMLETSVGSLKASYHIALKKIEKFLLDD